MWLPPSRLPPRRSLLFACRIFYSFPRADGRGGWRSALGQIGQERVSADEGGIKMSKRSVLRGFAAAAAAIAFASLSGAVEAAPKVAVITPYLAQPGTQFYVEGFQAAAKAKGWDVNVIDTKSDVAAVISRIEDMVTQ